MRERYTEELQTVRVLEETKNRLEQMADRNGVTLVMLIRLAIFECLAKGDDALGYGSGAIGTYAVRLGTIRTTEDVKNRLEEMATRNDMKISALIRQAVIDYLDRHENEQLFQTPKG